MKKNRVVLEEAKEGLSRRKVEELENWGAGIPNPDEVLPKEDLEWDLHEYVGLKGVKKC